MNMRKAAAAAFGAALLGAGTSAVVGGGAAHGQLNKNKTGAATSSQTAKGGTSTATCDVCEPTLDASTTIKSAVGVHRSKNSNSQTSDYKVKSGNSNGSTHGSAKSGSQRFHIG